MGPTVTDNPERSRYELTEMGLTSFAQYRRSGNQLIVTHVESPPALRGKGTAARLMAGIAAKARDEGFRIKPLCSYAILWFRRHPEFDGVLA